MAIFFLKSATCLLVLLLFYRYVLQREAMYHLNRFYLLAAVVVSFLIPLYTIEVEQEVFQVGETVAVASTVSTNLSGPETPVVSSEKRIDWPLVLISLYLTITAVLLLRFVLNFKSLFKKIRNNQSIIYKDKKLILLKGTCSPFSFLDYIFVAQADFDSGNITDAVWIHESTHVREKHSWDNIFVEFLLVFLWFHPVLYWAKEAIKLNHEFIADQAALQTVPVAKYKLELFGMLLAGRHINFSSSLNFSLTKKRIEMMGYVANGNMRWFKTFAILPLLIGLIYFFSDKSFAQEEARKAKTLTYGKGDNQAVDLKVFLSNSGAVSNGQQQYRIENLDDMLHQLLREIEAPVVQVTVDPDTPMGLVNDLQSALFAQGVSHIVFLRSVQQVQSTPNRPKDVFYSKTVFVIEDLNGNKTRKTYKQLTEAQQAGLPEPPPVPVRSSPSAETFLEWKDGEKFALWLDGKHIPNQVLDRMKPADIAHSFTSFVHKNARSGRFPQQYQVHMYSEEGFADTYGPQSDYATKPIGGEMSFKEGN